MSLNYCIVLKHKR